METGLIIVLLASVLNLLFGGLPYIISTLKGKTKPNRVTWLLWGIGIVPVFAQWMDNSLTWASLPIFISALIPLLIFAASFVNPKAYWKLEKFDYICGFSALCTIGLWIVFQDVLITLILAVVTDILASLPTLRKSYLYPETELGWPFLVAVFYGASAFLVMERFDIIEVLYPAYLIIMCSILVYILRKQMIEDIKTLYARFF